MIVKVDGVSGPAETLVGNLDFFTIATTSALASDGAIGDTDQALFDKFIETISMKAQPIILSAVTGGTTFKFAVEHTGMWSESGATDSKAVSLKTKLEELPGAGTVTVTFAETL